MAKKKTGRRICQHCGAKRNIDQLEAVADVDGSYFQKGKEVTLYVCKPARRKSNDYRFLYCNGKALRPDIETWSRRRRWGRWGRGT